MEELFRSRFGGRTVTVTATDRGDGDIHPERVDPAQLRRRQRAVAGADWVMLDEVHGVAVHLIDAYQVDPCRADGHRAADRGVHRQRWPIAAVGDVLVGSPVHQPLAVWAADCAPLALIATDASIVAMVHAGWRGLAAGVVDTAVDALEAQQTSVVAAVLGPCIHPCCYEFGRDALAAVGAGVHASVSDVEARTRTGRRALDVPRAVQYALARRGIDIDSVGACTGCDERYFSHRRRREFGRHALVVSAHDSNDVG